jgi:starch-binding outer membrane protein, SusD/RagB family
MIMRYIINLFYCLLFCLATGCVKDRLEPNSDVYLDEAAAFNTPERTLSAVQGLYAGVKGPFYNGASNQFLAGRYHVFQDVRGEEFINETNNGVTGLQTWNFSVQSATNEVEYTWGNGYQAINRINVVLKGLDGAPVSDALKNQYRAEARFLRAVVYHSLVTLYGRPYWDAAGDQYGLVIYTEPQASIGGINNRPRSKVSEVYALILSDLNFAEANLPLTYGNVTANVLRAHRNAAIAFKTRVYLHMQQYNSVITEANKIVSATPPFVAGTGVAHALDADVLNVFRAAGYTVENIFSLSFSSQNLPGTQNSLHQYYSPGSAGGNGDYSLNTATGIVANTGWTATDRRRTAFVEAIGTKTWLRKWINNTDNVSIIRYAEVLLNLAEACQSSGFTQYSA